MRRLYRRFSMSCRCRDGAKVWVLDLGMTRCAISLFQPFSQVFGISFGMKHSENANAIRGLREINAKVAKPFQGSPANMRSDRSKSSRMFFYPFQKCICLGFKLRSQPRPLLLVPSYRLVEFNTCNASENDPAALFQPYRFLRSDLISSQETPSSGFFLKSSARRSSSAIWSGDNSSSISSFSSRTTSRCSSKGSSRNCSTISSALMWKN